jgi:hypothetical protein
MSSEIQIPVLPARKVPAPKPAKKIQDRVDYICKSLLRGSWGGQFELDLRDPGGEFVVAIVMVRAERNDDLKAAIMKSFKCEDWEDVPWHEQYLLFEGKTAFEIMKEARQLSPAF